LVIPPSFETPIPLAVSYISNSLESAIFAIRAYNQGRWSGFWYSVFGIIIIITGCSSLEEAGRIGLLTKTRSSKILNFSR
jgi:hypothetical protein